MSFGEELRRERELRHVSLREIAQETKINLRYLEALERNEFAHLPGGLFNRGFVRAYCQYIGVDSEAMVNAYLLEERTQAAVGPRRSDPADQRLLRRTGARTRREPEPARRPPRKFRARALLVLALVALLVAIASLVLWWTVKADPLSAQPAPPTGLRGAARALPMPRGSG